jgi:hypothetical protein
MDSCIKGSHGHQSVARPLFMKIDQLKSDDQSLHDNGARA